GADVLRVTLHLWERLTLNAVALVALEAHEELTTTSHVTAGGQRELPAARHAAHLVQLLHRRPSRRRPFSGHRRRERDVFGPARRGLAHGGLARRSLALLVLGAVLMGMECRHQGTDDDQGENDEAHRHLLQTRDVTTAA